MAESTSIVGREIPFLPLLRFNLRRVMELDDMNSVRRVISESFPTFPTFVRFLAGMLSEVSCQRILTGERFVTLHARVRFISRVKKNVTVEGSLCIIHIIY